MPGAGRARRTTARRRHEPGDRPMKRSPSPQSRVILPRLNFAAIDSAALAMLPSLLSRWTPGGAARALIARKSYGSFEGQS